MKDSDDHEGNLQHQEDGDDHGSHRGDPVQVSHLWLLEDPNEKQSCWFSKKQYDDGIKTTLPIMVTPDNSHLLLIMKIIKMKNNKNFIGQNKSWKLVD